jgi:hypothetical protein
MRIAIALGALLAGFIGLRVADFTHRILSPDIVAVAFAEGGDDAYYFFTIARNFVHGFGLTSDQVHFTTGFQPLWEVVCWPAFWLAGDRGAMAILYVVSLALWFASAFLLLRFVAILHGKALTPLATAAIATLFLCESQLNAFYVNGMETGLYLTLSLGLLIAFHRHLAGEPADGRRLAFLGVLSGLVMLARNDGVFLCAALLAVMLLSRRRPRPFTEAVVIVAVASVPVAPWLAYCLWASGVPMPQSGLATFGENMGAIDVMAQVDHMSASVAPLLFLKMRSLVDQYGAWTAMGLAAAAVALAAVWRREKTRSLSPASRWILAALAASCVPLLVYYGLFSAAGQFFERYFAPIKLLVVILLSILIARAVDRPRAATPAVVTALALLAIVSNTYWVWRDFNLPYRSYMGEEAYAIVRSPYATGTSRMGLPESGRIGFLFPTRVVNLDGKMRLDALRAVRTHSMASFIAAADLDTLMMRDFYVEAYDRAYPGWRQGYENAGTLAGFVVFAKKPAAR